MNPANELKEIVIQRTGLRGKEIVCPREQSEMTPCVCRDGDLAASKDGHCIGCGANVVSLLEVEQAKLKEKP